MGKPEAHDEDAIVNHSLKVFHIIGSPGYVNQVEQFKPFANYIVVVLPSGCTSTVFSNIMYGFPVAIKQEHYPTDFGGSWFKRPFAPPQVTEKLLQSDFWC